MVFFYLYPTGLIAICNPPATVCPPGVNRTIVLAQKASDENHHPCAFFSRRFSSFEKNYVVGDLGLLAVTLAFEEWRNWLADYPVLVWILFYF